MGKLTISMGNFPSQTVIHNQRVMGIFFTNVLPSRFTIGMLVNFPMPKDQNSKLKAWVVQAGQIHPVEMDFAEVTTIKATRFPPCCWWYTCIFGNSSHLCVLCFKKWPIDPKLCRSALPGISMFLNQFVLDVA